MAVRVVVAGLYASQFVTVRDHGHALRKGQGCQEISFDAVPHPHDVRGSAGSLYPPIPTPVLIGSIAILLAICLIVLGVIADEIVQSEAIVAGYEVDARLGRAAIVLVEIAAAGEPRGQLADLACVATPEAANRITVFPIPLAPARREASHLI